MRSNHIRALAFAFVLTFFFFLAAAVVRLDRPCLQQHSVATRPAGPGAPLAQRANHGRAGEAEAAAIGQSQGGSGSGAAGNATAGGSIGGVGRSGGGGGRWTVDFGV